MVPPRRLPGVLVGLPAPTYAGTLFRAISLELLFGFHQVPPYAPRPLYSAGPSQHGARFTPVNGPHTLYMAEDPETAFAELNWVWSSVRSRGATPLGPTAPAVLVSAVTSLNGVLDLVDPAVRRALQTSRAQLTGSWRIPQRRGLAVPTQQLGQAVYNSGRYQAIRYPSLRLTGHFCLAVFPGRLRPTPFSEFVEVWDPDQNINQRVP